MEIPFFGKVKQPLRWAIGLGATSILIIGSLGYLVINNAQPKQDLEELTVPVEAKDLTLRIPASGKVEPIQSVNVSPKNPGRLGELLVEQGQKVRQGQVLAIMENKDLQAQYAKAQADYQQAKARLDEALAGNRKGDILQGRARLEQAESRLQEAKLSNPEQIAQGESQVEAANARLDLAEARTRRYQSLQQQGAISEDQYQETLTEYRNARASLDEAERRLQQEKRTQAPGISQLEAQVAEARAALEELEKGSRAEEVAQLQAATEAALAQVQAAKVNLDDTLLKAPFDGIVTQKYATEGSFVTPTTSASSTASATSTSVIALAKGLEVTAKVPEVDVGQLKPGQPVEVVADAYPDQVFEGRVKLVAPEAIEEQNVTSFQVKVNLLEGQDELKSGMNVDVTFLGEEIEAALVVPTVAIVTEEGKTGVYVPTGNKKSAFKPVTAGITINDQTQILSGIKKGVRVYIDQPEDRKQEVGE
ncbi:MAG: efflux RND transporter periplasmic adaptor subunit [Spirulinaceae cyanobacterium]